MKCLRFWKEQENALISLRLFCSFNAFVNMEKFK